MVYFKFVDVICVGEIIEFYNNGEMKCDFSYIDDVVVGVFNVMEKLFIVLVDGVVYCIFNVGCGDLVEFLEFVVIFEVVLGKKVQIFNCFM